MRLRGLTVGSHRENANVQSALLERETVSTHQTNGMQLQSISGLSQSAGGATSRRRESRRSPWSRAALAQLAARTSCVPLSEHLRGSPRSGRGRSAAAHHTDMHPNRFPRGRRHDAPILGQSKRSLPEHPAVDFPRSCQGVSRSSVLSGVVSRRT